MLVLFDNGTPRTLAKFLAPQHMVTEARSRGWDELANGQLLSKAEEVGFEAFVTTDKNIGHQQNVSARKIAIVVLGKGRWSLMEPHIAEIVAAVNAAKAGSYIEVDMPSYRSNP